MRGTLSLKESEPGWKNRLRNRTFVRVVIDGKEAYHLRYECNLLGRDAIYSLCDKDGVVIKTWSFKVTTREISLVISESPPLKYIYDFKTVPSRFITSSGEIQASLIPSSSSRHLNMEDMEFRHKDYESVIHFRCPDEKLHTAIIVADLLLTPPYYGNE